MKRQLYSLFLAVLVSACFGLKANAQSNPSGNVSNGGNNSANTHWNANYLGLLGLLGLYGLKNARRGTGTIIDRPAV